MTRILRNNGAIIGAYIAPSANSTGRFGVIEQELRSVAGVWTKPSFVSNVSLTTIDETASNVAVFTVTTNLSAATTVTWTLLPVVGSIANSDVAGGITGSFVVNAGQTVSSVPITMIANNFGDNTRLIALQLQVGGNTVYTSGNITVLDTSFPFSSGGDTITVSGSYRIHTFNSSGTLAFNTLPIYGNVQYLVVAGGGGGAATVGGGGGAGGFLTANTYSVSLGNTITVTVGAGGVAGIYSGNIASAGTNGTNSVFGTVTAIGGGHGGTSGSGASGFNAGSGGSGGGGSQNSGVANLGAGTTGQGNAGGSGAYYRSGGGGGAGSAGSPGVQNGNNGAGGAGLLSSISGTATYYAGGGGGGGGDQYASNQQGAGGTGGGGRGSDYSSITALPGTPNTGGGGGGGANPPNFGTAGAAGGSGIVMVKYQYQTIPGQAAFTTPGTFSWTAPADVTSVCVVAVGGGGGGSIDAQSGVSGGGGGGGLGWKNNITVTPGQTYTVVVGAGAPAYNIGTTYYLPYPELHANPYNGTDSYFINTATVAGFGGKSGTAFTSNVAGGSYTGDGGGAGGQGTCRGDVYADACGGGGAGGYSGNGGNGGTGAGSGANGSGGGGGGGAGQTAGFSNTSRFGGGGGGVGILGQGTSGIGATYYSSTSVPGACGTGGSGGSNGIIGFYNSSIDETSGAGGGYGGGGGGIGDNSYQRSVIAGAGGGGAVRIIWGVGRAFPSTNTGDVAAI